MHAKYLLLVISLAMTTSHASPPCDMQKLCDKHLETIELYEQAVQAQEQEIEQLTHQNELLRIDLKETAGEKMHSPVLGGIACGLGTLAATAAASNRIGGREAAFSAAGAIVCLGVMELFK
jgi:hypothetical protein